MKKLVFFVILLVAAGGSAWYYFKYAKPVEKPQVMQAAITRGDIVEQVSATGTLEPLRRVDVGSQVSGVVQELFVDFNTIVRQGMVLAKIDPTLLQVQVEIQKANIQRQEGDIANQEVQLEDVRKQLERTRAMFDKGLQNQQQLEQAELSVKTRQAQIDSAKKSLIQARANLQQAELNVEYTTIKSPIDGVVVERKVDRGQTVQASMSTPSFFVLATDLRELKLTAMVDESEIGKIRPGMDVTFQVDAYGQNQFPGKVDAVRLNAMTQNNVVTYPVWINVPNPDLRLRPSMTASLKIIVSTAPDVVRVPNTALRFRPNNDIWTALGLTPPTAGQGRAAGPGAAGNGNGKGDERGQTPGAAPGRAGGQSAGAQPGAAVEGSGGQRQGGQRTPGSGMGAQSGMANLTPEQRQQMMERFGRAGGAGGRSGQGGRTGGRTGRGNAQPAPVVPAGPLNAEKIDEMFAPLQRTETRSPVWTWDEAKKELKSINLRLGVSDGTWTELISGDVQVGQQVVTGIILPQAARTATPGSNPLMGNQPGRGMPGMMPGGGGGGGGRGGGGGGRGGN